MPLEVRVHGRGGQGGVTCAKLIAVLYTQMGLHVQTFGDYGSERSGAPVQAFTRVDRVAISNRNKIYQPDHLIVLDEGLMGSQVLSGAAPGALLLLNTVAVWRTTKASFGVSIRRRRRHGDRARAWHRQRLGRHRQYDHARRLRGLLGAAVDGPEKAYASLGLADDLAAAQRAYDTVSLRQPVPAGRSATAAARVAAPPPVPPLSEHRTDYPATLKTGGSGAPRAPWLQ